MKYKKSLGGWGESVAAAYLAGKGYDILDRNVRTAYGELDLITVYRGVTVFIEVKTRSSHRYGYPEESITSNKQAHLLASAQAYLQAHPELDGDWQIDVLAIEGKDRQADPKITHFENIISNIS